MKKVITYGTYDLLHEGHINLLRRAKALGDYLIVGVTNDSFDRERGKLNVRNNVLERVEAIKSTCLVDQVIIDDFEKHLQLNQKKQQVLLDSTYYIDTTSNSPYAANFSQKFAANALSGHFDVVLSDVSNFDYYGNQGFRHGQARAGS